MENTVRVLIVEDREDHQKVFESIIESIGYRYEIAATVKESANLLARMYFHVALVDLSLDDSDPNNRDGLKVLARVKALDEGTKAIVLTAYGSVPDADRAFTEYDIAGFIDKGVMDIKNVMQRIRAAAEEARQEMARPARQRDITAMIKGQAISQLVGELGGSEQEGELSIRGGVNLEGLLKRLLNPIRPLLPDKRDAIVYRLEGDVPTVRARFWSRMLGKPVGIWVGKREEMRDAVQMMDESVKDSQKAGYDQKIAEVFDALSFEHLGGVVYILATAPFEEFEAPSFQTIPL